MGRPWRASSRSPRAVRRAGAPAEHPPRGRETIALGRGFARGGGGGLSLAASPRPRARQALCATRRAQVVRGRPSRASPSPNPGGDSIEPRRHTAVAGRHPEPSPALALAPSDRPAARPRHPRVFTTGEAALRRRRPENDPDASNDNRPPPGRPPPLRPWRTPPAPRRPTSLGRASPSGGPTASSPALRGDPPASSGCSPTRGAIAPFARRKVLTRTWPARPVTEPASPGLPNSARLGRGRSLPPRLQRAPRKKERPGPFQRRPLLDIDAFKAINDAGGHPGRPNRPARLREAVSAWMGIVRTSDLAGRGLGGRTSSPSRLAPDCRPGRRPREPRASALPRWRFPEPITCSNSAPPQWDGAGERGTS